MSEISFNLDVHPKYGFYEINDNGIKCEFMELEGYYMRCNKDIGVFKKGKTYLIDGNSNDYINYFDYKNKKVKRKSALDPGEFIPVEWFEDGTFTLISKEVIINEQLKGEQQ